MLVGALKPNTVADLLRTLTQAKAYALLLFAREGQHGFVSFEGGKISSASLETLRDDEAISALKSWGSGYYALRRRTESQPAASLAHLFLLVADDTLRRRMASWLSSASYEASSVSFKQELDQVIEFLHPHMVITDCPRASIGATCEELIERWKVRFETPPTLLPLTDQDHTCDCERPVRCHLVTPLDKEHLLRVVRQNSPRLPGIEQPSLELARTLDHETHGLFPGDETTATVRVAQPIRARPVSGHAERSKTSNGPTVPVRPTRGGRTPTQISRGTYLLRAAVMLLLGSAAIWTATYLLSSG